MMPTIYEYEVEVRLTNPNTKEVTSVTRREHAYSVGDAYMQATVAVSVDAGSSEIRVVRIAPPLDAVIEASKPWVDRIVDGIMGAGSLPPTADRKR